ncbi:MAG: zf-HC2 domain-containing protein [Sphingomonas bacterium]
MGNIIQLHDDPHGAAQSLLPWYVNGTLDPAEAALVEAHLANCADCRADLDADRALGRQVAGLSLDVEHGWAAMRARAPRSDPYCRFGSCGGRSRWAGQWRASLPPLR